MSAPAALLTFLIAVGIPAGAGTGLLYLHLREHGRLGGREDRLRMQTWIAEALKVAERKGGRVTVVELVAESAMDSTHAERALSALVERGIADIEISESGLLVYRIHDVELLSEKRRTRRVIDA